MNSLPIPIFLAPLPKAPDAPKTPPRLVAAVRYDYEVGLLSIAQCTERYSTLLGHNTVRGICMGELYPDVPGSRMTIPWRK